MKGNFFILMVLCAAALCIAGCTETTSPNQLPNQPVVSTPSPTVSKIAALEPSQMALGISDLPSGYSIFSTHVWTSSEIKPHEKNLGWIKGYTIAFSTDLKASEGSIIGQTISIYPAENMQKILAELKNERTGNLTVQIDLLPNPKIGDNSNAYTWSIEKYRFYEIHFTKKNVLEQIALSGSSIDYELLKTLVKKAADKVN
jgi:hypothetical protein